MDSNRHWVDKVMERRGVVDRYSILSVLRYWSEGRIEKAIAYLKKVDREGCVRCSECSQVIIRPMHEPEV